MKKGFFVLLAVSLLVFAVVPAFAGEAGSAIGTFGFGFTSFYRDNLNDTFTAVSFDLDLISKWGIAVSFGNMVTFKVNVDIYNLPYIGFGYRYLAEKWDIGGSIIAVPFEMTSLTRYQVEYISDALVGVKISGGYWITNSFGFTLTGMLGSGVVTDLFAFSIRPGISVRL